MVGVALHPSAALPISHSIGTETLELVERRAKAPPMCGREGSSASIEVNAFMCGIVGFCEPSRSRGVDDCEQIARRMACMLAHRGPDDEGSWADAQAGVALGHRRLAILDLSQEGHQPMHSQDGRYVLVFNGEIYNFEQLRRELENSGHCFRGHSDTEVMLAAFCQWGFLPALERFVGMFALALWDWRAGR